MMKMIANETIIEIGNVIAKDLKELITSTSTIERSMESLKEMVKGMSLLEVFANMETITLKMTKERLKNENQEESKAIALLIECHAKLDEVVRKREVLSLKELSALLSKLYIALDTFKDNVEDSKKDEIKSKIDEIYRYMFMMLNTKVTIE